MCLPSKLTSTTDDGLKRTSEIKARSSEAPPTAPSGFDYDAGCSCRLFCTSISPANLPVQAGGIALNIVAVASLLNLLVENHMYDWMAGILVPLELALYVESFVLQGLLVLRAMTIERLGNRWDSLLRQELCSRRMTAGWAAL